MKELEREYTLMFNGVTDTINYLEKTAQKLRLLQQSAEEMVVAEEEKSSLRSDSDMVAVGELQSASGME